MIKKTKEGYLVDLHLSRSSDRLRKTFTSIKLAKAYEIKAKNEHLQNRYVPELKRDRSTFVEFVDEWWRLHAQVNMINPERAEWYVIEKLKSHFGNLKLIGVTQKHIEEWKAELAAKVSSSTVNRQLTTLKSIFNKAVEWGKIPISPAKKVKKMRENEGRTRYLTSDEISKLLSMSSGDVKIFLQFAIYTGMRLGNLQRLEWDDIDFSTGVIHVLKPKSGKKYDVPLNDTLIDLIKTMTKGQRPTGIVLNTRDIGRKMRRLFKEADIKNSNIHVLRHTFASHLVMKGNGLYAVSQLLGHADMKMTQRYSHLGPNHQKLAVNSLKFKDENQKQVEKMLQELSEKN